MDNGNEAWYYFGKFWIIELSFDFFFFLFLSVDKAAKCLVCLFVKPLKKFPFTSTTLLPHPLPSAAISLLSVSTVRPPLAYLTLTHGPNCSLLYHGVSVKHSVYLSARCHGCHNMAFFSENNFMYHILCLLAPAPRPLRHNAQWFCLFVCVMTEWSNTTDGFYLCCLNMFHGVSLWTFVTCLWNSHPYIEMFCWCTVFTCHVSIHGYFLLNCPLALWAVGSLCLVIWMCIKYSAFLLCLKFYYNPVFTRVCENAPSMSALY